MKGNENRMANELEKLGFEKGEVFLHNFHISPYEKGSFCNHDPDRTRKLLLHKREIRKLKPKLEEKGLAFIPLKVYFKNGKAKVEMALAKGKKLYDKRVDIAKRDSDRDMERAFREKQKGD